MSNLYISLHALPPLTSLLGTNQVMVLLPLGNDGSQGTTSTIAGTTLDALSTFFNAGVTPLLGKALSESDLYADFVVSGLMSTTSSTLTTTRTAGAAYVLGTRAAVAVDTPHTYPASSDTYVDLSTTGVLTYTSVANGAAAPAVAANSLRLEKVMTNSSTVFGVTNLTPLLIQSWQGTKQLIVDPIGNNLFMGGAGNTTLTGLNNIGLGLNAQQALTTGTSNTAIGAFSQLNATIGVKNVAVGSNSQQSVTVGNNNTAVGAFSQTTITYSSDNTAVGASAQYYLAGGNDNTAVGSNAQFTINNGSYNTAVGNHSQTSLTDASYNSAYGHFSQRYITTGNSNVAFGALSQSSLTNGVNNVGIGTNSQAYMNFGTSNVGVGNDVQYNLTYGRYNTTVGGEAHSNLTTTNNNTAVGYFAGYDLGASVSGGSFVVGVNYTIATQGTTNFTLVGASSNAVGTTFTATGPGTGNGTATPNVGDNNTMIGSSAGRGVVYGSGCTIIGANVTGLDPGLTNHIILADGAGNQRINVTDTGNVGIRNSAATAALHLPASGTQPNTGALKFTPGSLLATPEAGAEESDSLNARYYTDSTGARRQYQSTSYTVLPSAVTVGASPFLYQNATGSPEDILITGGTVSLLEFSRDGTTWYPTGLPGGFIPLSPLDRVRVTYSSAPTMTHIPR